MNNSIFHKILTCTFRTFEFCHPSDLHLLWVKMWLQTNLHLSSSAVFCSMKSFLKNKSWWTSSLIVLRKIFKLCCTFQCRLSCDKQKLPVIFYCSLTTSCQLAFAIRNEWPCALHAMWHIFDFLPEPSMLYLFLLNFVDSIAANSCTGYLLKWCDMVLMTFVEELKSIHEFVHDIKALNFIFSCKLDWSLIMMLGFQSYMMMYVLLKFMWRLTNSAGRFKLRWCITGRMWHWGWCCSTRSYWQAVIHGWISRWNLPVSEKGWGRIFHNAFSSDMLRSQLTNYDLRKM
jgi:hypothetical protein